jgi:hypothetical protein
MSVKKTSLKSRSSRSVTDAKGLRTTPGVSVGISSTLMPWCLGASGSVRTNVSTTSASWAPEVHTFCPLTTKWSPSRSALVRSDARSEPAPGSLMPSAAVISARRIGTAHFCCCSAVPKVISDAAMIPTPCELKLDTIRRRANSAWCTYCCRIVAFRPPNSGALPGTNQPLSNSSRCQRRAQSGTCDEDRGRSSASASAGECSSRNATNSARKASTSASNVSCTAGLRQCARRPAGLRGPPADCGGAERAFFS